MFYLEAPMKAVEAAHHFRESLAEENLDPERYVVLGIGTLKAHATVSSLEQWIAAWTNAK